MRSNTGKVVILCFVLLVLYGFIYYRFIWNDRFDPQIEKITEQIQESKREKEILDRDLANIETLMRNLNVLNIQNERFNEFLMNEANISDSVEYIDKLDRMFNNSLRDVRLTRPRKLTVSGNDYYEFAIDFKANLSLSEIMNLIDYLEGGSKKVRIPKFIISPEVRRDVRGEENNQEEDEIEIYSVEMSVNLYSLDIGNIDKVYEYSRQRFNRFHMGDDINFSPFIGMTIEPGIIDGTIITRQDRPAGGSSTSAAPAFVRDINIEVFSFLSGGRNFSVYNREANRSISFKTKITPQVRLTFYGDSVDVYVIGNSGESSSYVGTVSRDVINIGVTSSFPTIEDNKDLGLSIQVINDSGKQIRVQLEDSNRRVTFLDRNGSQIIRSSQIENLRVI
ncbi:UNVERIFIED_CONTAM: hypothetical protein Cloal_4304 [Acetivibrio alkalicellulosi]